MKKVQILAKKLVKNELKSLILALGFFFKKYEYWGKMNLKSMNIGKKIVKNELKSLILALGFKKKNEYWQKKETPLLHRLFPNNELNSLVIALGIKQ